MTNGYKTWANRLTLTKIDFGIVTGWGTVKQDTSAVTSENGGVDDDIYRFTREGPLYPCRELTVVVFDAETKTPLANASLNVANNTNDADKRDIKTDTEGNIKLCLDAENDFQLLASNEGYLENTIGISTKGLTDDMPSRLENSAC